MNKLISIKTVNEKLGKFDVESAGYCFTAEKNYSFPMSTLTREYQLIFVTKGEFIIFDHNGKQYGISENHVAIIKPMVKHYYIQKPHCENYWVDFFGFEDILAEYGLNPREINVMRLNKNSIAKMIAVVNEIISEQQLKQFGYNIYTKQKMLELILILAKADSSDTAQFNSKCFAKIKPAVSAMNNNYQNTLSMDEYAKLCNMSKSSFMHNFAAVMHTTPIKYINSIKMQNAKFLLENSTLSVSEISADLGFSSPLYFSDMFFRYFRQRPTTYRDNHLNGRN